MSWRVVVISSRSKLDYQLEHLVVRSDEDEKRIYLGDISVLICESTAISLTAYLLSQLTERKIKIIFCDAKHNPQSELVPYYGGHDTSGRLRIQLSWSDDIKAQVWQRIIASKINHQAHVLDRTHHKDKAKSLRAYLTQIEPGDTTNREGHAAKVYFNTLFGDNFARANDEDVTNAVLNYGYSVLLACFNREIVAAGYFTQLGIWHDNSENPFNLGSDLMESFRPIIDAFAYEQKWTVFGPEQKHAVVNLLNSKVYINNSEQYLNNAIDIYVHSVLRALEQENPELISNWYEL
ncbi:type II CRISPR-associated endonuclease Cas1 [bacterium]|nr:type II CRISPR-associated endonuclease Cas1 [bacterium]